MLVSIGLLSQQLRPKTRVHATVAGDGVTGNFIQERSRMKTLVGSRDPAFMRRCLQTAVLVWARHTAPTTGATAELTRPYGPLNSNAPLAELAGQAFAAADREPATVPVPGGFSDLGLVNQTQPSVRPGLSIHTPDFEPAESTVGESAVMEGPIPSRTSRVPLFVRPRLVWAARKAFGDSVPSPASRGWRDR
jgi:metal-dependent amidase/aminoacylase/carboxypeptidase family protein